MPLYEYECQQCHRHTEKRQKFSDPEITECPHCGGPLQRVITAPNVSFKGGGWYKDLYSSAKPAAPANDGGNASGSTDAGAAPKPGGAPVAAPPAAGSSGTATTAAPAASTAAPAATAKS